MVATADDPTRERSFRQPSTAGLERQKLLRNMRKKLQQMEGLEALRAEGHTLDAQQVAKLTHKALVERIVAALEADAPMSVIEPLVEAMRGGGEGDGGKERRRRKHKLPPAADAKKFDTVAAAETAQPTGKDQSPSPTAQPSAAPPPPINNAVQPSPVKQPDWDSLVPLSPKEPLPSPRQPRGGPKTKRGALSLSLGGSRQQGPSPSPPVASKGPAWGRPSAPAPAANPSLKAILAQQAAEPSQAPVGGGKPADKPPRPGQSGVALSLGELIDAKVDRRAGAQPIAAARKQGPAWGCAGGSPPGPGPSFADIQVCGHMPLHLYHTTTCFSSSYPQAQQEQQRIAAARSWGSSPTTRTTWRTPAKGTKPPPPPGDAVVPLGTSPGGKGLTGTHHTSRWYVPHQQEVVPLHVIQSEQGQGDAPAARAWGRAP